MVAALTLLTPAAALVALAAAAPVAAALAGRARADRVRRGLGLPPPERRTEAARLAALAAAVALLGLAAAQPALTRDRPRRVRRDVQALFVVDVSRSMAAAPSPSAPARLARARAAAARLRAAIPDVPSGVATLTDRVLPDLLPVADERAFDAVVARAVAIDSPPPANASVRATTFDALAAIPSGGYFAPAARRRIVVVLTDGESAPFSARDVARALAARPGYALVAVRFWRADESIRGERAYRPDPSSRALLEALASAAGGTAVDETDLGSAAAAIRRAGGSGPTERVAGADPTQVALAPLVALLALVPLLALGWRTARAHVRSWEQWSPGPSSGRSLS